MSFPTGHAQAAAEGKPKVIGYYMDASDDYYKAGFQVFKAQLTRAGRYSTSLDREPRPSRLLQSKTSSLRTSML
jgi:hypothetical protein